MSGDPSRPDYWALKWGLSPDGVPIRTRSSRLFPVRTFDGELAMLKISVEPEERSGAALLAWWDGRGAARVLEHEDQALLIERATGHRSLASMATSGDDDVACRILCAVVEQLHSTLAGGCPPLVPLDAWFGSLFPAAERHGGLLARCASEARKLLDEPTHAVALHGDIHHGNVLDFSGRGWLAIDPKGVWGDRGFDYANMVCNPTRETALEPGRMRRRIEVISEESGLAPERLLRWVLAWSGLSAVWMVEDGETPELDLSVAAATAAVLDC